MRKVILYRRVNSKSEDNKEIEAAKNAGFTVIFSIADIQKGDLVIPRYRCTPFYNELNTDVTGMEGKLLNSLNQHQYVADLGNYVRDLKELTPITWDQLHLIPDEGPFVLKGSSSKKDFWKSHCWAEDKKAAIEVHGRLLADSVIGYQNIYIRKFVPLHTYYLGVTGMPVTEEYRFFICDKKVLCGAFYWSNEVEELDFVPNLTDVEWQPVVEEAIRRIGNNIRAYCLDLWVTADNNLIVGELNDLQQAGLSMNEPSIFYTRLMEILNESESA